jgi:hypothetical protein
MYTDDTILTQGAHKFTKLCRVPPDYLILIHKNKSAWNRELQEYVDNNIEHIIMRKEGILPTPPLEKPCDKVTYCSKKDANIVLRKIIEMGGNHRKPIRSYECNRCGGWHLTSWTWEDYKQRSLAIDMGGFSKT